MKHVSGIFQKLTVVVAAAAALSSCNRAEYAALPQTSSYHGTQYVAAKPTATAVETPAPVATPTEATPAAPAPEVAAAAPAAAAAPVANAAPAPATTAKPAATPKLNFIQKALVNKVVKKATKLASKAQLKQHSETAKTTAIEGQLRTGLLFLLGAVVLTLIAALVDVGFLYVIAGIVGLLGVIFILLYLLDSV